MPESARATPSWRQPSAQYVCTVRTCECSFLKHREQAQKTEAQKPTSPETLMSAPRRRRARVGARSHTSTHGEHERVLPLVHSQQATRIGGVVGPRLRRLHASPFSRKRVDSIFILRKTVGCRLSFHLVAQRLRFAVAVGFVGRGFHRRTTLHGGALPLVPWLLLKAYPHTRTHPPHSTRKPGHSFLATVC
jgi:hypothetical protein